MCHTKILAPIMSAKVLTPKKKKKMSARQVTYGVDQSLLETEALEEIRSVLEFNLYQNPGSAKKAVLLRKLWGGPLILD